MAINPTFQNNANPNGGKPVPKNYQGSHLDPNVAKGKVIKRMSTQPVQMWKVKIHNPNLAGGKTLLWTDHERLANDLVTEINHRAFQSRWDFMNWIKHKVPQAGFGQAGTCLMDAFSEYMDILEHEISNAKGRAASAKMFNAGGIPSPVYDPDPLEEAVDAILDNEADTFGIGQPNRKSTAEWEPDVPDPDVDLMKSIRDACTR